MTRAAPFSGSARFQLRRRIGKGGMGVVYEAYDRQRGLLVALKTLNKVGPSGIFRLKSEFRALTEVVHPNLVSLFELVEDSGHWFFTMELIRGRPFIQYVREPSGSSRTRRPEDAFAKRFSPEDADDTAEEEDETAALLRPPDPQSSIVNLRRLRSCLLQLVEGVIAIHDVGKLHRDIKPSNVLVTDEGRVAILDFGLTSELTSPPEEEKGRLVGTPSYMAPEQPRATMLTAAADWYAVGVILYEALTGQLPFPGRGLEQIVRKQRDTPLNPNAVRPGAPEDLTELCMALLRKDPKERPTGFRILERLRQKAVGTPPPVDLGTSHEFIGRTQELQQLDDTLERVRQGEMKALYVIGPSGIGKTALVERFLEGLSDVLILRGRCFERESLPYKGIDQVVDALAMHLRRLEPEHVQTILPAGIDVLKRVFPVLGRVPQIASARDLPESTDHLTLRREAFHALKTLFTRISDRQPIVIAIDNMQWCDEDSAQLLDALTRPPEPPTLLLVGIMRNEGAPEAPTLKRRLSPERTAPNLDASTVLTLGPLSLEESRRLLYAKVTGQSLRASTADRILGQTGGNPFVLDYFARFIRARGNSKEQSFDELLDASLAALPPDLHRLLEILSVAKRPMPAHIAFRAAGSTVDPRTVMAPLVRTGLVSEDPENGHLEVAHDRIRRSVLDGLDANHIRSLHASLRTILSVETPKDNYALYVHAAGAHDHGRAAQYAEKAGDQARLALAFDRAAALYLASHTHRPPADPLRRIPRALRQLHLKHAGALRDAGRCDASAAAFLRASDGASHLDALEYTRCAADQYLRSGNAPAANEALGRVLDCLSVDDPSDRREALETVLDLRERLAQRGLDFREQSGLAPRQRLRIDSLATAAQGLSLMDTVRGAAFQLRHLLEALEAGDPLRIARALAVEVSYVSGARDHDPSHLARLIEKAIEIANRFGQPHVRALCLLAMGVGQYMNGAWTNALGHLDEAEEILLTGCTGVAWELSVSRFFALSALTYRGDFLEARKRARAYVEDADARGHLYASTLLRLCPLGTPWLAEDDPDRCLAEVDRWIGYWPEDEFYVPHWLAERSRAEVELYRKSPHSALKRLERAAPRLDESHLIHTRTVYTDRLGLEIRAMLMSHSRNAPGGTKMIRSRIDELRDVRLNAVQGSCGLADALCDLIDGRTEQGLKGLHDAATVFGKAEMPVHAACASARIDQISGRSPREATAILLGLGIRAPMRWFESFAPLPSDFL